MNRRFRLATVERLRTTEFQSRGQELRAATLALAEGRARYQRIAAQLDGTALPQVSVPHGVVQTGAYRQRLRAQLEAAASEVGRLESELAAARSAWSGARARLRAVATLHDRHREALQLEQRRRDQAELDDLAAIRVAHQPVRTAEGRAS